MHSRMLLHDTIKDSHVYTSTSVSAVCECGTERPESLNFFCYVALARDMRIEEARNRMTENIKEISNTSIKKVNKETATEFTWGIVVGTFI